MSMRQLKITNSITSRDSLSLEKYLKEISKIKLISPEEEPHLVSLIKKGDNTAFERLIKANLRFVVSVAKQYQNQGLPLSDLINEGNLGLMKAARSFDQTRGFKFISYAVWWVRQNIIQALAANARLIRLPLNKMALKSQIQKANSAFEQTLERPATPEELAEILNIELDEVNFSLSMNDRHISLDTPLSDDEENGLLDVLENKNADSSDRELNYSQSLKTEIDRMFQSLTERQKETLCCFFGIGIEHPLNMDAIAERFNVTQERVRQIKEKAINKIKATANFNLLRSYLAS